MRTLLVHARLPDTFAYYAAKYSAEIFNLLPIKGAHFPDGCQGTPHELFYQSKPRLSEFRVFGCPCVAKKYTISPTYSPSTGDKLSNKRKYNLIKNTTSQQGIRGIFIGFPRN